MNQRTLDRDSAVPLYIQLADTLRGEIESGEWHAGQKIPSENELNRIYGISRMTVRSVLSKLVDEGLLFRVHGKGTFVVEPKISTRSPSYQGIREQLEDQGMDIRTEMLASEHTTASARIAEALEIEIGSPIQAIRRLRYADGEPISIHESYVPDHLAPGLLEADLAGQQLCRVLEEQHGLRMTHVHETLESAIPSKDTLKMLQAPAGTPVLRLEQRISSPSGVLFEFTRILFRGDKVRLDFTYSV